MTSPRTTARFGLVYRRPAFYRLAMWLLYRGDRGRHRLVVDAVAEGRAVVDVCCGDCAIAEPLIAKRCRYVGLELNPAFVRAGLRRGLDVRLFDVRDSDLPHADVVLLQSSLYQFIDRDEELLHRMLEAARERVVVAEPVRNWTSSDSSLLRAFARRLTHVDGRVFEERYTEERLLDVVRRLAPSKDLRIARTDRDLVIVIEKRKRHDDAR